MPNPSQIERTLGDRDERIYRLPVRVFEFLRANCYLVIDGDYQALIDTGSHLPYATQGLADALEALRDTWGEQVRLSRIILTHGHIDHYGGLDALRQRTDAPVAMHGLDRRVVEDPLAHHRAQEAALRDFFPRAGLAGQRADEALALYHGEPRSFRGGPVETELADGDRLDHRFLVHHVPGHCAGQVCLQLGGILFTADHVLPATFPHLAPERSARYHGVRHYLSALDRVAALADIRLALPGHGPAMPNVYERVTALHRHHERMVERVLEACAEATTLEAMTRSIYPSVDGYHALLALEKVGAYVEALVGDGRIACLDPSATPWSFVRREEPARSLTR